MIGQQLEKNKNKLMDSIKLVLISPRHLIIVSVLSPSNYFSVSLYIEMDLIFIELTSEK